MDIDKYHPTPWLLYRMVTGSGQTFKLLRIITEFIKYCSVMWLLLLLFQHFVEVNVASNTGPDGVGIAVAGGVGVGGQPPLQRRTLVHFLN